MPPERRTDLRLLVAPLMHSQTQRHCLASVQWSLPEFLAAIGLLQAVLQHLEPLLRRLERPFMC